MIWLNIILYKEIKRIFRIRKQTLLPPVMTSVLYFLIFWQFIWERIQQINWFNYIDFIVPWLMLMAIVTSAYWNSSMSFFWMRFQKSLDEILVASVWNNTILLWFTLWWVIRWIVVWFLVLLVSLFFTKLQIFNIFYILCFVVLSSMLFSLAWFLNAIFAKNFDDISIIPTFVITPLTYLWWIFYSIDFLPDFWRYISYANPILYMVNWIRYWFLWISDVNVYFWFWILVVSIVLLYSLNLYLIKKWVNIKN